MRRLSRDILRKLKSERERLGDPNGSVTVQKHMGESWLWWSFYQQIVTGQTVTHDTCELGLNLDCTETAPMLLIDGFPYELPRDMGWKSAEAKYGVMTRLELMRKFQAQSQALQAYRLQASGKQAINAPVEVQS